MNRQVGSVVRVTRQTVQGVRDDRITFIAASLAYYAFVSLVPLMLLAVVGASVFGGEELALALANRATTALGPQAGELVRETLVNTTGQAGAGVVGTAVLLWSGLKLFRGMDVAFSTVYGSPLPDSIVDQVRDGVVTLGAVGIGIVVTVAVGVGLAILDPDLIVFGVDFAGPVGTLLLVGGLAAAFLPLYYFLPGEIEVREAVPGALFAAVGWTLLETGFRVYAASAGSYDGYGVLGAVLLLVTFLYFGGLILLVGVVLNAVLAGRVDADGLDIHMTDTDDTTDDEAAQRASDESTTGTSTELGGAGGPGDPGEGPGPSGAGFDVDDIDDVREELERIYDELDRFEGQVEDRTVHREEIEGELKRYVRGRLRRGKARGWGPYLVLLYGTAMTLGAFVYLSGGWAILAMLVIWLSTLGLYTLMLIVGGVVGAGRLPGRLRDRFGAFRD